MPLRSFLPAVLWFVCAADGISTSSAQSPAPPPLIDVKAVGAGSGVPVVFIPGLATPGSVWNDAVAKLQATHPCYVVTLAGFGGQPPVPHREHFLVDVRDAIIASLRQLHVEHPVIVGHSLGGVVALDVAAHAPELPGSLVIVDALPFLAAMMGSGIQHEADAQPTAAKYGAALAGQTPEQFASGQERFIGGMVTDPAKAHAIATQTGRSDPATTGQAMGELIGRDLRPQLGAISCPVVVFGALADKIKDGRPRVDVEAAYRQQYANVPQARFEFFEKSRHFIMVDDPQGFNDALAESLPAPKVAVLSTPAAPAPPASATLRALDQREEDKARKEAARAKQVALACKLYASDNDGNFPKDLGQLYPTYITTAQIFLSPFQPATVPEPPDMDEEGFKKFLRAYCAFEYSGGTDTNSPEKVLLRSKYPGSDGLRTVVHTDCSSDREK